MRKALYHVLPGPARDILRDTIVRAGSFASLAPHGFQMFHDIRRALPKEHIHTVFDVGDHVGQFIKKFRTEWPAALIYSFEPDPRAFAKLKQFAGQQVRLFNLGFARELGTLDAFSEQERIERIDFLRIDSEDHDLAVLAGGTGMITSGKVGIVMAEVSMNPGNRYHVPFQDVHRSMERTGFLLFGIYEQTPDLGGHGHPFLQRSDVVYISPGVNERNTRGR